MTFQAKNPAFETRTRQLIELNEFMKHIGFNITKVSLGEIEGEMPFSKIHEQQNGFVHGGVTSTVADIVCGFAAYTMVSETEKVFTVESKVAYYRPGIGEKILARGRVVKAGKRFHFCEGEVFTLVDQKERLIAKCSTTMAVTTVENDG